jgi:integration host factor subunit beta
MSFSGTIGVAFKPWGESFVIKSRLVLKIADRFLHIRNRVVERAVNVVLDEIVTAMARKDRVELRGFGAFSVKDRAGRISRNPKSGRAIRRTIGRSPCAITGRPCGYAPYKFWLARPSY